MNGTLGKKRVMKAKIGDVNKMTKEELRNYYKIIERNKVNDDIEVIDLYNVERSNNRHIRLLFAYNKLYYTGDMGTYVFGNHVFNIREFFRGKEINPYYWQEKVEAASQPVLDTNVDFDKVVSAIREEFEDKFTDTVKELIENFESDGFFWESNEIRAHDKVWELCNDIGWCDPDETAESIICRCKDWSRRFLYACEVIQWIENEILED